MADYETVTIYVHATYRHSVLSFIFSTNPDYTAYEYTTRDENKVQRILSRFESLDHINQKSWNYNTKFDHVLFKHTDNVDLSLVPDITAKILSAMNNHRLNYTFDLTGDKTKNTQDELIKSYILLDTIRETCIVHVLSNLGTYKIISSIEEWNKLNESRLPFYDLNEYKTISGAHYIAADKSS